MSPAPILASPPTTSTVPTLNLLKEQMSFGSGVDGTVPTNGHSTTITDGTEVPTNTDLASSKAFAFDDLEEALAAFRNGEFLLVMDDEGRENEGDLIIAADKITTEKMAWFIKVTSGYICISLPGDKLEELELPLMVHNNMEHYRTAYTITVDYAHGTTTGISAHDRALTARKLAAGAPASEFTRPGHLVPLRARDGGVLTRKGHTEAALDLCRLVELPPAGLLCELVNDDPQGSMARRDDCRAFADKHGIKMISIEMIVNLRARLESEKAPTSL